MLDWSTLNDDHATLGWLFVIQCSLLLDRAGEFVGARDTNRGLAHLLGALLAVAGLFGVAGVHVVVRLVIVALRVSLAGARKNSSYVIVLVVLILVGIVAVTRPVLIEYDASS